jgi:hypothetical protein
MCNTHHPELLAPFPKWKNKLTWGKTRGVPMYCISSASERKHEIACTSWSSCLKTLWAGVKHWRTALHNFFCIQEHLFHFPWFKNVYCLGTGVRASSEFVHTYCTCQNCKIIGKVKMETTGMWGLTLIIIWSRHCLDASTAFLSGQCVYIWVKVEYHKIIWVGIVYREDVSTLKLNDTKNTFIFPMTSIGKLNEVE